jgi:hypothetical protein
VAFEDGFCAQPDRFVQRIVAVREDPAPAGGTTAGSTTARYPL